MQFLRTLIEQYSSIIILRKLLNAADATPIKEYTPTNIQTLSFEPFFSLDSDQYFNQKFSAKSKTLVNIINKKNKTTPKTPQALIYAR